MDGTPLTSIVIRATYCRQPCGPESTQPNPFRWLASTDSRHSPLIVGCRETVPDHARRTFSACPAHPLGGGRAVIRRDQQGSALHAKRSRIQPLATPDGGTWSAHTVRIRGLPQPIQPPLRRRRPPAVLILALLPRRGQRWPNGGIREENPSHPRRNDIDDTCRPAPAPMLAGSRMPPWLGRPLSHGGASSGCHQTATTRERRGEPHLGSRNPRTYNLRL